MISDFKLSLHSVQYVPVVLTLSIFFFTSFGWYFGKHLLRRSGKGGVVVRDSLVAAIFGLSALVLGFTFSGSASRYADRMDLIRVQALAFRDVYSSINYLDQRDRVEIKKSLDDLLNCRLTIFNDINSLDDVDTRFFRLLDLSRNLQEQVLVAALRSPNKDKTFVSELLVPQIKNLSTLLTAGVINAKSHPPRLLMSFLFGLLCISAFLIGYTMAIKNESDWILASLYTALTGFSLYVILSLELPNLLMPYDEVNRELLMLRKDVF